jgi:hypothetical protein
MVVIFFRLFLLYSCSGWLSAFQDQIMPGPLIQRYTSISFVPGFVAGLVSAYRWLSQSPNGRLMTNHVLVRGGIDLENRRRCSFSDMWSQ